MTKYYIIKETKFNKTKNCNEISFHKSCEPLCNFYDTKSEAYDRLMRQFLGTIKEEIDSYELDYDEIVGLFFGKNFNFELIKKDKNDIKYVFTKTSTGVIQKIAASFINLEINYIITPIEKENILYTFIKHETDENYNILEYKYGIFDKIEDVGPIFSLNKYNEEDKELEVFILDKEKIFDDKILCQKMTDMGFIEGFHTDAAGTLNFFDKDILFECMLKTRKNIIKEKNEKLDGMDETKVIKKLEKANTELRKTKENLTKKNKELEDKINEIRKLLF